MRRRFLVLLDEARRSSLIRIWRALPSRPDGPPLPKFSHPIKAERRGNLNPMPQKARAFAPGLLNGAETRGEPPGGFLGLIQAKVAKPYRRNKAFRRALTICHMLGA